LRGDGQKSDLKPVAAERPTSAVGEAGFFGRVGVAAPTQKIERKEDLSGDDWNHREVDNLKFRNKLFENKFLFIHFKNIIGGNEILMKIFLKKLNS
jgi:hypothetical protein